MVLWITNNPKVADVLRKADIDYVEARHAARKLKLADKIVALRKAKDDRQAAYDSVAAVMGEI